MRQILVLRGGALGDFIVTLPALALLRQRWPTARIELIGNATAAEIARNRGMLDAVHSQHDARWSALYSESGLPAELARWLGEFDLVVSYWPDPDGDLRRRFPARANQVFLSADAMPGRAPAAAHYCEPLRALGLEAKEFWCPLQPVAPRVGAAPVPTISIHPGSGSPRKNWSLENWLALISRLPAAVSIILGEAELEQWSHGALAAASTENAAAAPRPRVSFLVLPSLEELIAHFSQTKLFLGHDSGVSHLAAACGARCMLLFGPTEPSVWAPPAPNVRVLRSRTDLSSISVAEVCAAVRAALSDQT